MTAHLRVLFSGLIALTALWSAAAAAVSDRLPPLLRTNTFLAGQAYGCIVRFETYLVLSIEDLERAGAMVPVVMRDPAALFGIEIAPLKIDLRAMLLNQPGADDVARVLDTIETIGRTEYAGTDLATGHMPAWLQVASCTTLFRQLQLYEAYPA